MGFQPEKTFTEYLTEAVKVSTLTQIVTDMSRSWRLAYVTPYEFLIHGYYEGLVPPHRLVSNVLMRKVWYASYARANPAHIETLRDKYVLAKTAESLGVPVPACYTADEFNSSVYDLHRGEFVLKHRADSRGAGILDASGKGSDFILGYLIAHPDFFAQPYLKPASGYAHVSGQHVPTVRVTTWKHRGIVHLNSFIRIRSVLEGGEVADNLAKGNWAWPLTRYGSLAGDKPLDLNYRPVELDQHRSEACRNTTVTHYADANLTQSIVRLANSLDVDIVGWDVALTDNGAKLLEGNFIPTPALQGVTPFDHLRNYLVDAEFEGFHNPIPKHFNSKVVELLELITSANASTEQLNAKAEALLTTLTPPQYDDPRKVGLHILDMRHLPE